MKASKPTAPKRAPDMKRINPADKKQLHIKIPNDLVEALDRRCRQTGRSRTAEAALALAQHLASPIDNEIADIPKRTGEPTKFAGDFPAELLDALGERSRVSLRTLRVEVRLALEKHLAGSVDPLFQKPEQLKGPKGRSRKTSSAPSRD